MSAMGRFILENRGFFLFLILMFAFRSSLADWNRVPTGSMLPTIQKGDHILVDKLAYDLRIPFTHHSLIHLDDPRRGDIVVFDSAVSNKRLVKRVIGIPGDRLAMDGNRVMLNGRPLGYEFLSNQEQGLQWMEQLNAVEHLIWTAHRARPYGSFEAQVIPEGHYFVMGDNRDNSHDSRRIGLVPRKEIVGRTRSVIVSLDPDQYWLPRSDRFLEPLDPISTPTRAPEGQ